ncbi:MAG TPA: hypothetical protein VKA26_00275 [Ignavibacteriaceae bacterium]|nr:hypothetical protein [Ignavibacteriaceae bacterium]
MLKWYQKLMATLFVSFLLLAGCTDGQNIDDSNDLSWQKNFNLSKRTLTPTGRNQYFILEPGFQLVLGNRFTKLTITVLDETKVINGVTTRVVEEMEWIRGEPYEVARNFFAIDDKTKDVFYFGEEVDFYKDGKIVDHSGAWIAGENGATAGLQMSGDPKVGMKYYQELAPNVAMDRAEIISVTDQLKTPAGNFSNCLTTKEGTALNFLEVEFKTYAPGIGLIQDESLLLTQYGFIKKDN